MKMQRHQELQSEKDTSHTAKTKNNEERARCSNDNTSSTHFQERERERIRTPHKRNKEQKLRDRHN